MMPSLRRMLLVSLMSVISVSWIGTTYWVYNDARNEVEKVFDANIEQMARALLALVRTELMEHGSVSSMVTDAQVGIEHERAIIYQVRNAHGDVILRTPLAPKQPLEGLGGDFNDWHINEASWRIYTLFDDASGLYIHVGELKQVQEDLISGIVVNVVMPLVFVWPMLAGLIWLAVGQSLRTVKRVANQVGLRNPSHLEMLDESLVPVEVRPMVVALNKLLVRVRYTLDNERRFTSDAAHELRTPLAVLRNQAQVALASVDERERFAALNNIVKGVDRATQLVSQLLTLARVDAEERIHLSSLDIRALCVDMIAELVPGALSESKEMELLADDVIPQIAGDADALYILVRNLEENALRHSPSGGTVTTLLSVVEDRVLLCVCDMGAGVAPAEREKIFSRFYRSQAAVGMGSGLGLSIVQRIAEHHSTQVIVEEADGGGAAFCVEFAIADAA